MCGAAGCATGSNHAARHCVCRAADKPSTDQQTLWRAHVQSGHGGYACRLLGGVRSASARPTGGICGTVCLTEKWPVPALYGSLCGYLVGVFAEYVQVLWNNNSI